jgi:predicted transcriptional regulator of viral defense system
LSQLIAIFGTMVDLNIIERKVDKGDIFFISDFTELGNYEAVRKSLQRLTKEGKVERIAKGIYFLPKKNERLGTIYPHAEQIAKAIAKRDKARIIATGSKALNLLSLSTQIPLKVVFLTDGSARNIKVGKQTIQFKKTNTKNLSIEHRLTNLIIQAFKAIGKKNVTQEQLQQIQSIIDQSDERDLVYQNLKNAPVWIQKIILSK